MANFNPQEFDNALNPYALSEGEQAEVMKAVADDRLKNPSGDYFRLELEGKTIDIPKLEYISQKTKNGKIAKLSTIDYINKLLDR